MRPTAALATGLMVVFSAARARAHGLVLDCGCFGSITAQQAGLWTVLRDAALGVPSLLMLLWPARRLSIDASYRGRPDRFQASAT